MATIERAIPVGGASLNFKVVGGTAEPVNPKENTIWVNTDAEITGWAFAAGEPADPVHGSVWIKTIADGSVAFNALKKNAINVCPIGASQWQTDGWVDREAKIYQGGKWVDWVTYLFEPGMNPTLTALAWKSRADQNNVTVPTVRVESDAIEISLVHPSGGYTGVAYFDRKNLSGASKIVAKYTISHALLGDDQCSTGLLVWQAVNIGYYVETAVARAGVPVDTLSGTLTVDVSELSGEYYIGFGIRGSSAYTPTLKITSLTIE